MTRKLIALLLLPLASLGACSGDHDSQHSAAENAVHGGPASSAVRPGTAADSSDGAGDSAAAVSVPAWTCSMHPQVRLPKPGTCPICSMPLVPAASPASTNEGSGSMLELSEHARAMASVETVPVQRRRMLREIRVVGKVQYNETTLANITTRVEGYVERLFVDYTGIEVKPGDHLVEIYSPDLVLAQQELLIALDSQRNAPLVASAKRRLLLWGLTPEQVDDLVRDKKVSDRITLFSPIRGTVTEKLVVQKAMVKPGEMLYRLANLESVWVYLDVYEYELPWVQYGQMVEIHSEAYPGRSFTGRVWFISPVLNEATRTVQVLLNINNTDHKLKPGMYVSAVIRAELLADGNPAPTGLEGQWSCPMHPLVVLPQAGQCPVCKMALVQIPGTPTGARPDGAPLPLAVPVTAVLDSGVRKLVYVEKTKGQFAPVEIVTGPRTDDAYPVLSGLNEGDKVAVRGSFLLDSQSQIRGLPSLFYKEGQAAVAGHQHGGISSPTAPPAGGATPPGHDQH